MTSTAGTPSFTTVSVRIPESAFRLIVPEIIEIVPGRVVGKVKCKPDGLALIQNILDVGYGRSLLNARSSDCFRSHGCDGIVGGSGNAAAGHAGYCACTARKPAVLKGSIGIGRGNGHQFAVIEIHNVGKPAAATGIFSITGIGKLNGEVDGFCLLGIQIDSHDTRSGPRPTVAAGSLRLIRRVC